MNRTEHGRGLLRRWEETRPTSFYEDDVHLRATLAFRVGPDRLARFEPALRQAGADAAGPLDRACALLDRPEHLPRLERWSGIGERTEEVVLHPAYDEAGRLVWRSGILSVLGEPGNVAIHAALAYLFAMAGESAHLCAVGCTAGLIKAIQRAGSGRMRAEWLPRLLDPDYDRRLHAAQFLTEVQGGSDVGANACAARPDPAEPGAFRLTGEKWFCSNVHADLYAVTARPEGAASGTAGLAGFVVPRRLDGQPNGVFVRRLKPKLGTRPLPTAEVDFEDALAWPLGGVDGGFKLMIGVVINTSRLAVATSACGAMRRAYGEARRYAEIREAFGRRLVEFPAVRQQLAEMRALATAGLSFTLFVAAREDRLVRAGAYPEDDPLFRTAVNLAKYVTSVDAGLVVHHGIEVLGGNGTIEDFSPLPRLYRDAPVQESWEGPHNTLMAQILRDALRAKMHDAFTARAEEILLGLRHPALAPLGADATGALEQVRAELAALLRAEPDTAALHLRGLIQRLARVFQATLLLEEADDALAHGRPTPLPAIARFFVDRYVAGDYSPIADAGYAGRLAEVVA